MKIKARIIIPGLIVTALLIVFVFPSPDKNANSSLMSEWGKILKGYAENTSDDPEAMARQEIQQATDFYILSGMNREDAEKEAARYVSQRNALYEEAIGKGYSVTDEEVREYLEQLKKTIDSADNREDVYTIMKAFDSEQDYWDFQFKVYQKDLPIQKYRKSLDAQ